MTICDGTTILCSIQLTGGSGSCNYTFTRATIALSILTQYEGNALYAPSNSTLVLTVDPSSTPATSPPPSPTPFTCGAPIPSQPMWVCKNGRWEATGDQVISVNHTDLTAPVLIMGSLNVTNPDAVIIVHYENHPVLNVTGSGSLQGTLIVEMMNDTGLYVNRTVVGDVGELTQPFDSVDVPSLDRCIDAGLDYHKEDSSMGLLLQPRKECAAS